MKHIFFVIALSFVFSTSLFASLHKKSAIVYYGENISYPLVGIHDYIIVQPEHIDTARHGFSLYKDKIYAYISIGEIDKRIKEYKDIKKEWIVAQNKNWKSDVLDIKNKEYREFIFTKLIEPRMREGFKNFFFDTLDSYYLYSKKPQEQKNARKALVDFINEFHKRYGDAKLILNRGFEIIDSVHNSVNAVLFESYYKGIGGKKLSYMDVSQKDRKWLDTKIQKIQKYDLDVISVEYLQVDKLQSDAPALIKKIQQHGMIPYVGDKNLLTYGKSSKNAIKREVLTLIDESKFDRVLQGAHRLGALELEYLGYIEKLYNVGNGLPSLESLGRYKGVIIWIEDNYKDSNKLYHWIESVKAMHIPVVFMRNFAGLEKKGFLQKLGIKFKYNLQRRDRIMLQDMMMGYEIEPSLSLSKYTVNSQDIVKPLLKYKLGNGKESVPVAITSWGGYAFGDGMMASIKKDNLWVVNPFLFFQEALHLDPLLVPDVTTHNGKRILFSHVDGDGIMNKVEGIPDAQYSGEVIYRDILSHYKIPHSVSVIGADVEKDGLYPNLSSTMSSIAKKFYALDNVEAATHTFSHPFQWGVIDTQGSLSSKYRFNVKNYHFSLENELERSLERLNKNLVPASRPRAKTVFWSGDCAPREKALSFVYKHKILNINGGDTFITKLHPWLSYIAPLGIERDGFYQVYVGAQNENVFTNDWRGPFWGFKRVVQTFQLTNTPKRLKPIDIYYHLYSGSKKASLKALKYVFDWAIRQDVIPMYTSKYIPKVMDFYEISMAHEGDEWLVDGMKNLKTLRMRQQQSFVDFAKSPTVLGVKHYQKDKYIALDGAKKHFISFSQKQSKESYLVSANAEVIDYKTIPAGKKMVLKGEVPIRATFALQEGCKVNATPLASHVKHTDEGLSIEYEKVKKANIDIVCK